MNIDLKNFSKNVNKYIKIQDDTYQDILWIDDIDTQQAQMQGKEIVFKNTWFPNHWEKINILDRMDRSYDEIVTNCDKYNLVIFDMNMENDNGDDDYQSLKDKFSKYDISLPEDDTSEDKNGNNFWTTAGIYLYLLLLTKGYPADRMLIYTANSDTLKDSLKFICPALELKITRKDKNKKINLETYYPENSYYRIRRLVLQACDYWKKDIDNKKDEDIPFNKIYFSKDTDKQISTENFKELLERVEMMFPVIQPASPKKVYYQAARILCEYHEENTKIQKIDQYIYPFHAVCRNFRNWSSHNKFHEAEMPADIFALLFCITLRTYFDFLVYVYYNKGKQEKISKFEEKYFAYEDVYNFKQSNIQNDDIGLFDIIKDKLIKGSSLPLVLNRKTREKSIPYSELVWLWGEDKNNRAHIHYILFPLVMKDYSMQFNNTPNNMKLNALGEKKNLFKDDSKSGDYTYTGFMESACKESYRICYENNV